MNTVPRLPRCYPSSLSFSSDHRTSIWRCIQSIEEGRSLRTSDRRTPTSTENIPSINNTFPHISKNHSYKEETSFICNVCSRKLTKSVSNLSPHKLLISSPIHCLQCTSVQQTRAILGRALKRDHHPFYTPLTTHVYPERHASIRRTSYRASHYNQ